MFLYGKGAGANPSQLLAEVQVPVEADGAFTVTLTVPADAAPGGALIYVDGSNFDGKNCGGDCVVYSSSLVIGAG
ncbi:MAG: hypothetical protein ABIM89_00895 [Mycobacteriales bacterium]